RSIDPDRGTWCVSVDGWFWVQTQNLVHAGATVFSNPVDSPSTSGFPSAN
ncbi:hypothetical protein STEG23_029075, partial [Scotinomys teguina]